MMNQSVRHTRGNCKGALAGQHRTIVEVQHKPFKWLRQAIKRFNA